MRAHVVGHALDLQEAHSPAEVRRRAVHPARERLQSLRALALALQVISVAYSVAFKGLPLVGNLVIAGLSAFTLAWVPAFLGQPLAAHPATVIVVFAFVLSYTVMFALGGRLMDAVGTRMGLALSVAVWSVASAAHALANGAVMLGAARFFLGVGEGA